MVEKKLTDVDISDIFPPPDERIVSLVKALRRRGYTTMGSCEGGKKGDHPHPFPWVTVYGVGFDTDPTHQQLTQELVQFNRESEIKWTTRVNAIQPTKAASDQKGLSKLQGSARKLADFLFNR